MPNRRRARNRADPQASSQAYCLLTDFGEGMYEQW
jgi:hypothetical protein